LDIINYFCDK